MNLYNFGEMLANKNIELGFEQGSYLNALLERDDVKSEIINSLSTQFVNEIKFYKNKCFTVLKEFNNEIAAKAPFLKDSITNDIIVKEVKVPYAFEEFKKTGVITNNPEDYKGCSISTSLMFVGFEPENVSDIRSFFKTEGTSPVDEILAKYDDSYLRKFLLNYGILIHSSYKGVDGYKDYTDYQDYRSFGQIGHRSFFEHSDHAILMYYYILNRINNPVATNLKVDETNNILSIVKEDLELMMSNMLKSYEDLVNEKYLVANFDRSADVVYVIGENLPEFMDKASKDVWSAIKGCSSKVKNDEVSFFKLDYLLTVEEQKVQDYNSFMTVKGIENQTALVMKHRELYNAVANHIWNSYVADEDKEFTPILPENMEKEIRSLINHFQDNDILNLNPALAIEIVGKIYFGNTSFYRFVMDTQSGMVIQNFDNLSEEDSITVAGMLLIARTLVSQLVAK